MQCTGRTDARAFYADFLRKAEKEGRRLPAVAELGKKDLFFLLVHILGRTDADRDWIFDRCREVEAEPDGRIDLWAREHYKSTIITFALTIRDILCDPEVTVGIFSHTRPIAKGFLRQIKREFEQNELLKACYPEVLWRDAKKQAPKWSEDEGIIVRRKGNPKEATVEAWGLVDGQPTSRHFKRLIFDDVVTRESVASPDMIRKTTYAWELALNLSAEGGKRRYIGTRYHVNDTYRTIMARGAAEPRIHPATADGTAGGAPVLMSKESLAQKRREMGPYTFGCQMLQDPVADRAQGFRAGWLRYWDVETLDGLNLYILVDPASARKETSDYTAIFVVGLGPDEKYRVVDMVRDRLNLTGRTARLMELHRRYRPLCVGYEQYGKDADIEHIEYVQQRENYRFEILPLAGKVKKEDRIRKLVPLFEQGRVLMPRTLGRADSQGRTHDLTRVFIDEEYGAFPVCAHDDMLDCLARILDPDLAAVFPSPSLPGAVETSAPCRFV